jgi:polyisoprenoid-binding protein YceI
MTITAPRAAAEQLTGRYELDPSHSSIGFVARHAMVTKVRGTFNEVAGSGWFDATDPSGSNVELVVEAASVDTRNPDRDAHLRSDDFFAVEQHPTIRFASTKVEVLDETTYRVTGDLTIRDVTRPVSFDLEFTGAATDPYGNRRIGFEGRVVVNRKDWGLTWNAALETGGILVSEKVTLEFEVSAIRAA